MFEIALVYHRANEEAEEAEHGQHRVGKFANLDHVEHEVVAEGAEVRDEETSDDQVENHRVKLLDLESSSDITEVALHVFP